MSGCDRFAIARCPQGAGAVGRRSCYPGTMPSSDAVTEAFERALLAERRRNVRIGSWVRFVSVSAFLALVVICGVLLRLPGWQGHLHVLVPYWALSLAVLAFGGRSVWFLERGGGIAIALLDMPVVFLMLRGFVTAFPEHRAGPATFGLALFMYLVLIAQLALDTRVIVLAAAVAGVLAASLQLGIGAPIEVAVMCVMLVGLTAVTCMAASARSVALVADVAREQRRRERLGRYFSPEVAALLADRGEGAATGEEREITILFSDLRGFTALSERLGGPEVVAILNQVDEALVEAVFEHGGTLDKYLGDGIMAYFGAPIATPDHAARGVHCAIAMQARLSELNRRRTALGQPPLQMGIGVHTGLAVLGDIGAPRRREYTAIGDAVNVAARIQQATRTEGVPILVSAETARRAGSAIGFVPAGLLDLPGRTGLLESYVPA
jgi:adenylate cyclase